MTWSYNTALTDEKDQVRLIIGDTDTNDQQLQDEEIDFFLTQAGDAIYDAALRCVRALQSKYSRLVNSSVESVRADYSERAKQYSALAAQLAIDAANASTTFGAPIVTGISISEMDSQDQDTDRVRGYVRTGQYDNPPNRNPSIDGEPEWN